jgi:hypothetical protein
LGSAKNLNCSTTDGHVPDEAGMLKTKELSHKICRELFTTQQRVLEQHIATHGSNEEEINTACVGAALAYLTGVITTCEVRDPEGWLKRTLEAQLFAKQIRNFGKDRPS